MVPGYRLGKERRRQQKTVPRDGPSSNSKGVRKCYQERRGGLAPRSRASLTRRVRPPNSHPSKASMALAAASDSISTKPNPRGWPVSRSVIRLTLATSPCWPKRFLTSSSDAEVGRLPKYMVFKPDSPLGWCDGISGRKNQKRRTSATGSPPAIRDRPSIPPSVSPLPEYRPEPGTSCRHRPGPSRRKPVHALRRPGRRAPGPKR